MPYSTLYLIPVLHAPEIRRVGKPDALTRIVHGEPGQPIPAEATAIYQDGTQPWTWNGIPASVQLLCIPHEWAGEPTAKNLDISKFPLAVPPA